MDTALTYYTELIEKLKTITLPPLFAAIRDGDWKTLESIIERGEGKDCLLADGSTPVHLAVLMYPYTNLHRLLDAGFPANCPNNRGETPLYITALMNDSRSALMLMEVGAEPDTKSDVMDETPLMACARLDNNHCGWALMEHNVDPYVTNAQGQTALQLAQQNDSKHMLKRLGLYLDTKRHSEFTPDQIREAAKYAPLAELERLLLAGADPNAPDDEGYTPLFFASWAYKQRSERINLLLRHGADMYHRDKWSISFLSCLIEIADNFSGVNPLIPILEGIDINRLDDRGCNILHYFCYIGYKDVFSYLMELHPDTTCRTASGFLPIEIALARKADDEMYDDGIIEALPPISPAPRPELPRRLGHELVQACYEGDKAAIRDLLAAGAPVEGDDWGIMSPDGLHDSPLQALALVSMKDGSVTPEDMEEMTRMLVKAGADLDHSDEDYETPLHRAAKFNNVPMIRVLLEAGADLTSRSILGGTPLQTARIEGRPDVERLILDYMRTHGIDAENQ